MEGYGEVSTAIFTVEELEKVGSSVDDCTSQPYWVLGGKAMITEKSRENHGSAEVGRFRSLSGNGSVQGEPYLSLVDISPLRKPASKRQPTKAGNRRKSIRKKMQRNEKKVRSRSRHRAIVHQQLTIKPVTIPMYLRNEDDYSDLKLKKRIVRAKNSKTFRLNKDKQIDELTMGNKRLKIELMRMKQLNMEKMSTVCPECDNCNQKLKALAEENYDLKNEVSSMKKFKEAIRTRMQIFFQRTTDVLMTNKNN